MRVLIANLTDREQAVALRGLGQPVAFEWLDKESSAAAGNGDPDATAGQGRLLAIPELPLVLPPHAIARIDRVVD